MTNTELQWTAPAAGTEIPPLVKYPSAMQLFMFSAVTWNRHLIHYNHDYAVRDGLKNVAVHRALIGGFLGQMLTDWLGDHGTVRHIEWTVRGSAALDQPLTLRGTVIDLRVDDGEQIVDCEIRAENHEGQVIAPGKATVALYP